MKDVAIFHRDLRIEDNAALYNASINQEYFSLFVFDKNIGLKLIGLLIN